MATQLGTFKFDPGCDNIKELLVRDIAHFAATGEEEAELVDHVTTDKTIQLDGTLKERTGYSDAEGGNTLQSQHDKLNSYFPADQQDVTLQFTHSTTASGGSLVTLIDLAVLAKSLEWNYVGGKEGNAYNYTMQLIFGNV